MALQKGTPKIVDSSILFGDSTDELEKITQRAKDSEIKFSLLFTSPPYWSITDYYASMVKIMDARRISYS